jgi:hypothetical protein
MDFEGMKVFIKYNYGFRDSKRGGDILQVIRT